MSQTPNTTQPPVWHKVGDTNDPISPPFAGATGAYTPANYAPAINNNFQGPLSFCKDEWDCCIMGAVNIPASGNPDVLLFNMPAIYDGNGLPVYLPRAPINVLDDCSLQAFAGPYLIVSAIVVVWQNGEVRLVCPGTLDSNLNSAYINISYKTNVYGEPF